METATNIHSRLESKLGFDKIRRDIQNRCATDYAADKVASELFCTDAAEIRRRLDLTDEMRLVLMFEENFPTTGYIDTIGFLEALLRAGSSISATNLAKLKTLTDTTRKITVFFSSVKDEVYPNLKNFSKSVRTYPEVTRRIENILDRHGEIKDSASDELFGIRRSLREKQAGISKKAAAILRKAQEDGISDADAGVSVRDGKYLIPVATSSKRKLQGFIYDESSTGKTTFVEPAEIIALENEIISLQFEENREIARILFEFTEFLRPYIPDLMECSRFTGEIDFLMAKASCALEMIAGEPVISEDGFVNLRKARHPLLEKSLARDGKKIVPLTINLTPAKRILLISGPNAGGKSVCLKTAGLLQYMFQWGMLIPTSESSELPVFDRILVSIGDDQSLENDLSTYSSFLADMREMTLHADSKTLVLIDEFGSGTEPAAGGAIAEAILEDLDRKGVYGVITTHYTNLKLYAAASQNSVINGAMLFDSSRIEPMFKLEIGLPGNSFAFELARKMHLSEEIVKAAEEKAGSEYVGIEKNLKKIARNRRALDARLQKIKATDRNLEDLSERYATELETIRKQKKEILDEARKEAESIVKEAGAQVEKTIKDIKEAQAEKGRTKEARAELQGFMAALEQRKAKEEKKRDDYINGKIEKLRKKKVRETPLKDNSPLKVGEKVRILGSDMVGEVSRVSAKSITVIVGNLSSSVTPDKVERISSNEFREASKKFIKPSYQKIDSSITESKLRFSPELDVRGERLADALDIVTHYIDNALMLNVGTVRIIHGKGTGVLHDEIQKLLRTIGGVTSVCDEDIRQGGSGVTIVKF